METIISDFANIKTENVKDMTRGGIVRKATKALARVIPLLLVSALSMAQEAITLKDINFSSLPGDRFEVGMKFSAPPPTPQGYTIDKPARLVMDFPSVESGLKRKKIPFVVWKCKKCECIE